MAEALLKKGHQVTIVCGTGHGDTGLVGSFINGMRRGYLGKIEVIELDLPYSNYLKLTKSKHYFFKVCLSIDSHCIKRRI